MMLQVNMFADKNLSVAFTISTLSSEGRAPIATSTVAIFTLACGGSHNSQLCVPPSSSSFTFLPSLLRY